MTPEIILSEKETQVLRNNPINFNQVVLATRKSALALWQANFVKKQLQTIYPLSELVLLPVSTRGDEVLDRSLSKIGGKGLFIKELEQLLLEDKADFAVHSLKDIPVDLSTSFNLASFLPREDPRDAFLSLKYDHPRDLPDNSVIGTSSLRRVAQLKNQYPHLHFKSLRGNINTRIEKLERGDFDAIVLAYAGVKRLGLTRWVKYLFDIGELIPAPGQGALVLECLDSRRDMVAFLAPLNDLKTQYCVAAERAVALALGGSCSVPLAVYASLDEPVSDQKIDQTFQKCTRFSIYASLGEQSGNLISACAEISIPTARLVSELSQNNRSFLSSITDQMVSKVVDSLNDQGAKTLMESLQDS